VTEVRTRSADETRALARLLAGVCRPGDLLLLVGDLGAGKTTFTQGFAAGLGVTERVTSPTFTLANVYRGRLTLNHLDVYRIDELDEVVDLSLPELLDGDDVTLIEWGDTIRAVLPPDYLEVRLTLGDGDDDRTLGLRAVGLWAARAAEVLAAVRAWEESGRC
jgi:tRNA threonylcarbamoyladenosine biosynthesis protein TsaE